MLRLRLLTIAIAAKDLDPGTDPADVLNDGKTFTIGFNLESDADDNDNPYRAKIRVAKGIVAAAIGDVDTSKDGDIEIFFVGEDPDGEASDPLPVSIALADELLVPAAGFKGDTFDIIVTLSEMPKENKFLVSHLTVANGTAADGIYLGAADPIADGVAATGRSGMHQEFLVTITPSAVDGNLTVDLNDFEDQNKPTPNKYPAPINAVSRDEGLDRLTVKINKAAAAAAKPAGVIVDIANDKVIPEDGYLVIAKDAGVAAISVPGGAQDATPAAADRTPEGMKYNVIAGGLPNLETFLGNGGTIDLVSPDAGVVISEVMWGSDASDDDSFKSQWIEIRNTSGKELKTGADKWDLIFYGANETLPDMSVAANNVQDRIGTIGAGGYWSLAGKGQSGRSGVDESAGDLAAVVPTQPLISMQRVIDATDVAADGTAASSWVQSSPPGLNFKADVEGVRIGSPGAAPVAYPVAPVVEVPVVAPTVSVATAADIMISEIMVDTGGGRLPQWIEISNVSGKAVSLAGWSVLITNSAADADVVGASVSINLSGTLGVSAHTGNTGKGQSLLLVAWGARSASQINADLVMNVSSQVGETGRYTLISEMGFMIGLVPPQTTGVLTFGDAAGNLDEGWELPTADGARSSLIRREADALGAATMGTMANGWVLASDTALVSGPATWYGSDEDAGTPGYDAGGPLPVQLSHFRPARDKETGAAVITWSTQSELNNAGFFIKRSQQRDGQFKVINAAMVQGAGTTSEKQFYTYTDTTAQPNVVYYYQIEDVSLDGNRQTLTNGIRLKGHIGAAGKLTTLWGDLKTSQ